MLGRTWWRRVKLNQIKEKKKKEEIIEVTHFKAYDIWKNDDPGTEEKNDLEMNHKWRTWTALFNCGKERLHWEYEPSFQEKVEDPQISPVYSLNK